MTPLGVWLTITIIVTAGLFLGIVLSWVDPPPWVTPSRLVLILLVVTAADIVVTYLQQTAPVAVSSGGQDATAASNAGLVPASKIDEAQASQAVLSSTGLNSGDPRLVEGSLNGRARKAIGPSPFGGPFVVLDRRELLVAGISDGKSHAAGLGISTLSGSLLRKVTQPAADATDEYPASTADGRVYFLRTVTQWHGQNGTPVATRLMETSIARRQPAVPVSTAIPPVEGSLSVDAAGTVMAGICEPPATGGTTQACVYDLPSGRIRYVTPFDGGSPVTDDALSPDGKYLAYGDAAANPYGGIQIYIRDLVTGSTVRVSSQPGNNQQPSWVKDSAAPCVLFSNTETSGDTVYLSCLTARPGIARVGSGDYPVWLGVRMPAAVAPAPKFDWRAWWNKARPAAMLALAFLVGLLLGLFGGWVRRPAWASRRRMAALLVALGILQVGGGVVIPQVLGQSVAGLTTVSNLDSAQAGGLLLAEDATSGTGQLIGVRLNGTDPEALQFYPAGSAFIPVGKSASSFIFNYGGPTAADIRLVGPTGNLIRELATPPRNKTDGPPALATAARLVYFEEDSVVPDGPGSSTIVRPVIMRVALAGGPVRRVPLEPPPSNGPISVNATASELAAPCTIHGTTRACVYDLPGGSLRYNVPTPVTAIALSPDGQYVAYGNGIVLHAHSLRSGQTFTVSSLPGFNEQPDWLQGGPKPCLLFTNLQTSATTIYLECLTPRPAWAEVTQGEYPEWLGS